MRNEKLLIMLSRYRKTGKGGSFLNELASSGILDESLMGELADLTVNRLIEHGYAVPSSNNVPGEVESRYDLLSSTILVSGNMGHALGIRMVAPGVSFWREASGHGAQIVQTLPEAGTTMMGVGSYVTSEMVERLHRHVLTTDLGVPFLGSSYVAPDSAEAARSFRQRRPRYAETAIRSASVQQLVFMGAVVVYTLASSKLGLEWARSHALDATRDRVVTTVAGRSDRRAALTRALHSGEWVNPWRPEGSMLPLDVKDFAACLLEFGVPCIICLTDYDTFRPVLGY